MTTKVNFEQARQDHLAWMYKMRNYLNGIEDLKREEIVSHLHCRLGKWYYAEGKEEFGHLEPIKKFELKHIKLHQLAKDIFEVKSIGNIELAEDLYSDIERTSKQIVSLLNEAEYLINKDIDEDKVEDSKIQIKDKLLQWDKSKVLVIKTDTFGKIEYANQAFLDVTGYDSIEILGQPFDIIRHPDMSVTVQKWVVVEIMQGIEANVIVKCLAKSGEYFWALLDYKISLKKDGTLENIIIKFSGLNMSIVYKYIIPLYKQLYNIEKSKGLEAGKKYLRGFLEERNRTFDEYIRNLIMTGRDSFKVKKSNFFSRIFGWK